MQNVFFTTSAHCTKDYHMIRSKLETCIDILQLLAEDGPLKITHLINAADVSINQIKQQTAFLVDQGLIIRKPVGKKQNLFSVSESGLKVLKYFHREKYVVPVVEKIRGSVR